MFSVVEGWLHPARHVPSPNFNQRPVADDISLLVIHCISLPPGEFGGDAIERFFTNQLDPAEHPYFETIATLTVSAHLLIGRDGQVTQFVSLHDRAWHAGKSVFEGRENCNDFSVGIELEGTDTGCYTEAQYSALAAITRELMVRFPAITSDRIVAHSAIAPGRKSDPGDGFDWGRYLTVL